MKSPMRFAIKSTFWALAAGALPGQAQEAKLPEVVVTAPQMEEALKVVTDPKAPRQPLPAHDGADFLKSIPGFSVIRKGGTDGDPVFRGMAGSRLNILLDGEQILGGCGMRMDPPTAYVFPESYDRVTVLKGPQTVAYGPGNAAGTVLFERDIKRFKEPGWKFNGSLMFGSFGRNDQVADLRGGNANFYVQGTATRSDANDYRDGGGRSVHSYYTRWSQSAAVGLTPDDDTRIELSGLRSDGKAAYADRTMDGAKFSRENLGLKFEKRRISQLVEKLEAQAYHNYVDHVMDNYTMRTGTAVGMQSVNNPDRLTQGVRVAATLRVADPLQLKLGLDTQRNVHTLRNGAGATADNYTSASRDEDMKFYQFGLFAEGMYLLGDRDRLAAGLRVDRSKAEDLRGGGKVAFPVQKTTYGQTDTDTLRSGFLRYERDLVELPAAFYAGIGHVERAPDYWERSKNPNATGMTAATKGTGSTFFVNPEKNTQLDVGLVGNAGKPLTWSVAGYYSQIKDYILVEKLTNVNAFADNARNIDASTWGGEAGLGYQLNNRWKLDGTLAYVRGSNKTDGTALAQLPPLELRLGASYDDRIWSAGALLRVVSEQDRFDLNKGNIVGQDIGRTPGFAVFSINGGWRAAKRALIAFGVDNLFDRRYAEHISKGGAAVTGYTQDIRVNEPGRNVWVKGSLSLD